MVGESGIMALSHRCDIPASILTDNTSDDTDQLIIKQVYNKNLFCLSTDPVPGGPEQNKPNKIRYRNNAL